MKVFLLHDFKTRLGFGSVLTAIMFLASISPVWAPPTAIVRIGDSAAPGGAACGPSFPGGLTYSTFDPVLGISSSGAISFIGFLTGGPPNQGVFRFSSGTVMKIAALGDPAPSGGTFSSFLVTAMDTAGDVAFSALTSTGQMGIFECISGVISTIGAGSIFAVTGGTTPIGGTFTGFDPLFSMSGNGKIAFVAGVTSGSAPGGVFLWNGVAITSIATLGATAPCTSGGTFSFFVGPSVNNLGDVAFLASISSGSVAQGIFRGPSVTCEVLPGMAAPSPGGGTFTFLAAPVLSNTGNIVFRAGVAGGSLGGQGLFRKSGSGFSTIALFGQSTPCGGTFGGIASYGISGPGEVAFLANPGLLKASVSNVVTCRLSLGASFFGGTVSGFGNPPSINTPGDIVLAVVLSGAASGIFLV